MDFECSILFSLRMTLGSLRLNRKRKLEFQEGVKLPEKSENVYVKEVARAMVELIRLVGSASFRGEAGG